MLLEALNFAATYAISPRRRAGEINSSIALWARARRCGRDWASHEAHCRAFVGALIDALPRRRVAVVLGSGLLRDVPIEALSRQFGTVRLYDLQHLASVRAYAALKGLRNVEFEHRDLSGYASEAAPLAFLRDIPELDLVISANLLSQIALGIERQAGHETTSPVRGLLQSHVDGLSQLAATTCLITDASYQVIDKSGQCLEGRELLHGITLPDAQAEWPWTVAPFGEIDPGYKAVHRVLAIRPGNRVG